MSTRTATPAESWHDCTGSYRVRVVRRIVKRRRRYVAAVFEGERGYQRSPVGRTVFGDYPTPAAAVEAARLMVNCWMCGDDERVCNWRDVERVRADLRREAAK